jgi:capsular polysaccharide transport system ATP-binding protein
LLKLTNVHKSYGTTHRTVEVLKGINLRVDKGQSIGILGGNGAGKSTLIRIIGGTEYPSSGQVEKTMRISWPLAFGGGFQGSLTGHDNMRFIARIYGADYEKGKDFVASFSELGPFLQEPVKTYSSGMSARLAFAISMMVNFDCYLIDEVVAVGDARFHKRCHEELFVKRKDSAKIIVSHDAGYLKENCDTIGVLNKGELILYTDKDEAIHNHHTVMFG